MPKIKKSFEPKDSGKEEEMSQESLDNLVGFFSLLIEIDKRNKAKKRQKTK